MIAPGLILALAVVFLILGYGLVALILAAIALFLFIV